MGSWHGERAALKGVKKSIRRIKYHANDKNYLHNPTNSAFYMLLILCQSDTCKLLIVLNNPTQSSKLFSMDKGGDWHRW